ncbi:MAG TPA: UbiA family prenyltransferase [Dehalococcoidales bacterium]|nr:UbiA family prenyltransferase [Dehalococcoidales bacterium]
MQAENSRIRIGSRGGFKEYLSLIKPRETSLLVFIAMVAAFLAGNGTLPFERAGLIFLAVLLASAGANGLTNYLDRHFDARMERTRRRVLPSGRLYPAENALYFCLALSLAGLVLAWILHPLVFAADLAGTLAAVVYRKRATCVFPQGMIAGCAPILMGWLAVSPQVSWQLLCLCILIALWLPSHVWSIMLAHQEAYRQAGLAFFPINRHFKFVTRLLLVFSIGLVLASVGLYLASDLGWLYLGVALIAGLMMVYASWRLTCSLSSRAAWTLYKLSSYPYLGLLFLTMALDIGLKI